MSENPGFEQTPEFPELSAADRLPYIELPPFGPAPASVAERPKTRITTNLILFVATIFTTAFAGAFLAEADPIGDPWLIYQGIPFSFAIMSILLSHELGHYLMSRYHRVEATLPYFIPAPTLIGTFGAVIKIRSRVPDRRALLDIGAAGPIVGFVVSIPFLIVGLKFSEIRGGVEGGGGMFFGTSLLLEFMSRYLFPSVPEGHAIYLHPVALAGWLGLLVTMMNLLPLGSMDGGHIMYAVLGKWHHHISVLFAVLLLAIGAVGFFMGIHGLGVWGVWGMLNLFVFGLRHPPPVNAGDPLDGKRKLIAALAALIFILTFVPIPISY